MFRFDKKLNVSTLNTPSIAMETCYEEQTIHILWERECETLQKVGWLWKTTMAPNRRHYRRLDDSGRQQWPPTGQSAQPKYHNGLEQKNDLILPASAVYLKLCVGKLQGVRDNHWRLKFSIYQSTWPLIIAPAVTLSRDIKPIKPKNKHKQPGACEHSTAFKPRLNLKALTLLP